MEKVFSHLFAPDASPLEDRCPVLLIHGIQPDEPCFNWYRFIDFASRQPGFEERFKFYLLSYDVRQPVSASGEVLVRAVSLLREKQDFRRMISLGSSQGGLLYLYALQDPATAEVVRHIITLGCPFHGTPLVHGTLLRKIFRGQPLKQLAYEVFSRPGYWLTGMQYPNFLDNYCWENYDLPPASGFPPAGQNGCDRPGLPPDLHRRFLTYASFFGVQDRFQSPLLLRLGISRQLPQERLLAPDTLKNLAFLKHVTLGIVKRWLFNHSISRMTRQETDNPPLLVYNDGVASIASTLWLGGYLEKNLPDCHAAVWDLLTRERWKIRGRLFAGLDHRNWMEGKTGTDSGKVLDLLHPDQPPRSVFGWYLQDILRAASDG